MTSAPYEPPFTVTDTIIEYIAQASFELGRASVTLGSPRSIQLRRQNRIRTIHSSLAIENNTLTLDQVSAILNGQRVLGDPREIHEVKNAFAAYDLLTSIDPLSISDLLNAHRAMMHDLVDEAGTFRTGGVGIFDGDHLVHMAPPAARVPELIHNLVHWYEKSTLHPLIKSAIFHYEFEFIHPFQDGNGRIGRLWHTALLGTWNPVFYWLPVEELIQKNQRGYYEALRASDNEADSTPFVAFILALFVEALRETGGIPAPSANRSSIAHELSDIFGDQIDASYRSSTTNRERDSELASKTLSMHKLVAGVGRSWPELADLADRWPLLAEQLESLTDTECRILAYMSNKYAARPSEISTALDIPERTLRRINASLVKRELLIVTGQSSSRRYMLAYHPR